MSPLVLLRTNYSHLRNKVNPRLKLVLYIYIYIYTCIIKQPLNFGRFGFLPVSENNGNFARFGPFLRDLNFFCQVLFPHVESLATSHQITQTSAISAGKGANTSVLLYKKQVVT